MGASQLQYICLPIFFQQIASQKFYLMMLIAQINEIEFDGTSTMEGCEICGV